MSQKRPILGRTAPRIATTSRRRLGARTSYGYAVEAFARDVLGEPLDPWQSWLVRHAGELYPDGRPRFRQVLTLVGRQNGKTSALKTLALYWLFVERVPLVLGTNSALGYALESWNQAVAQAEEVFGDEVAVVRLAAGEQCLTTVHGSRYRIAAANRRGGRGLSIDRLICDEVREHHDWAAWSASVPAMNAKPHAQVFAISNQGDDTSVVLDGLRQAAVEGEDDRLGIFEWSAEDDCDIEDPRQWAMANPNLGRRIPYDVIAAAAARAARAGGEEEAHFRTEILCQRVRRLSSAIDPVAWERCSDPGDLAALRAGVALCVDVAPDQAHATLVAAARLSDDRVRVEVVRAWEGQGCTDQLRRELPRLLATVRPKTLGWFPSGPAAALAADLRDRGRVDWPPRGIEVDEIRSDVAACCMGLAEQVTAGKIAHSDDPLLNAHVGTAERLRWGDAWVFSRRGQGHVDACYALAGSVHLARTLPSPVGKPRILVAD